MAGERTEQASPRRLQKARAEGDRPRSRDLVSACAMLAGTLILGASSSAWLNGWGAAYQRFLGLAASPEWRGQGGITAMLVLRGVTIEVMLPVCLVLLGCAGAALAGGVGQGGGWSVNPGALQLRWTRIDPVSNLKSLASLRAVTRLGKTLLPAGVLLVLAWSKLMQQTEMPVFSQMRMPEVMKASYDLLVDAAWILFLWSSVDYAIEYRSWSQRLKMSKQELRDEYKETEGNPQIRGRIRNIRRQLRARTIRADVARASVVITNPTHYAVALSFDFATMDAPRVLVKGRNLLAEQIKTEARWAGVPIVENPPLARSLYRTVEAGQAIPFDLYAAVAGILAYLYRQQVEERVRQQAAAAAAGAQSAGTARAAASRAVTPSGIEPLHGSSQNRAAQQPTQPDEAPQDGVRMRPESGVPVSSGKPGNGPEDEGKP